MSGPKSLFGESAEECGRAMNISNFSTFTNPLQPPTAWSTFNELELIEKRLKSLCHKADCSNPEKCPTAHRECVKILGPHTALIWCAAIEIQLYKGNLYKLQHLDSPHGKMSLGQFIRHLSDTEKDKRGRLMDMYANQRVVGVLKTALRHHAERENEFVALLVMGMAIRRMKAATASLFGAHFPDWGY